MKERQGNNTYLCCIMYAFLVVRNFCKRYDKLYILEKFLLIYNETISENLFLIPMKYQNLQLNVFKLFYIFLLDEKNM